MHPTIGTSARDHQVILQTEFFDERHSVWMWLSLAVMLAGLALVMPRKHERAAE